MTAPIDGFLSRIFESRMSIVVKRLSANDTGATGGHQAGPYIPKQIAFELAPRLKDGGENPGCSYPVDVASHAAPRTNRLVWYNTGTRDECRITSWSDSRRRNSLLKPHQTGSIVVLAFEVSGTRDIAGGHVWFCDSQVDEEAVESMCGPVDPGVAWFRHQGMTRRLQRHVTRDDPCQLNPSAIPADWLAVFPDASQIIEKTLSVAPVNRKNADLRLMIRRDCEYKIFKAVEDLHVMPAIRKGFGTVDEFVEMANSVTNRRKSRSGRSLELHLKTIFDEAGLDYAHGARTEGKKTPDFIFPSADRYHDPAFPDSRLRMLGVKTTCKDRWRQVISEADRIKVKHLATLQEGVSVPQFDEMRTAGIRLVVPRRLHRSYPKEVIGELLSLEEFIKETRELASS